MAENDQDNEEYTFGEFDSMESGNMGGSSSESPEGEPAGQPEGEPKNVKRNALIVVGIVIGIFILYKVAGAFFMGNKEPVKPEIPPVVQTAPPPLPTEVTAPPPIQPAVAQPDNELKQKVSSIESNEQNIKTDVTSLKDQVNTVDTNISNLNAEISKLNQSVTDLTNQVAKQSTIITMLIEKAKAKHRKPKFTLPPMAVIRYNIQAVIPGRAWLIGSNGSTLTVREGTKIPNYGVVRLIDSIQGRVITSSGKVIKFSQADS